MDLVTTFAADEIVASTIGTRIQTGERDGVFALVDLGRGMANGPTALADALLGFRGSSPLAGLDAGDRGARHLVVTEFTGADTASIVGCVRIRVGVLTDAARSLLVQSEAECGTASDRQISMSRLVVRHEDAQISRWIRAWLVSEVLRAARCVRRPYAYAGVNPTTMDALADIGVVFERITRPATRRDHATVLLRVNALASERRVRLDHRIPKLPVTTWAGSRYRGTV